MSNPLYPYWDMTYKERAIVFVRTKKSAHLLTAFLQALSLSVDEMHGDLSQAQRLSALDRFEDGTIKALICTDLASRGIDVAGVEAVIEFDMARTGEEHVHRAGR
ncbi:hypothetical protein KIPB_004910 [Kipferlia bialata]|uniref:Helicase C-terminal domain-containing protein n=1 Tax=Kipferlia bialata TaxID=797122 RepID=A0A9K3GIJ4_9EUKA|nr:hypothetical protein KIPB_004910 [Kipferlia bialata]|eukprot:g4910.t1